MTTQLAPPPIVGQKGTDLQYVQFTPPEVSVGDCVIYSKAGRRGEMTAFVQEIVNDGSLNLMAVINTGNAGVVRPMPNVLHKDDPRQNEHRRGVNGLWVLPAREEQRRHAMEALIAKVEQLTGDVDQLKKGKKPGGSNG
jgi:hypothetical protein